MVRKRLNLKFFYNYFLEAEIDGVPMIIGFAKSSEFDRVYNKNKN